MQNHAEQGAPDANIDAQRAHAAILLASGQSITYTAATVGAHRNTVSEWIKDPQFTKLVDAEAATFLRETRVSIRQLRDKAFSTLNAVLDGSNDAARARVALAIMHSLGGIAEPETIVDKSGNKVIKIEFVTPGKVGANAGG